MNFIDNLINNFSIENLILFFRNKLSSFKPIVEEFEISELFKGEKIIEDIENKYTDINKIGEANINNTDDILVIAAKSIEPLSTKSGKKMQYEIAKKILKQEVKDAAFFIFYDDEGNFRFSFIRTNYDNKTEKYTSFKRYTYFVSPKLTNKTFIKQINQADFKDLDSILQAFSVSELNKDFYQQIANWYFWAVENVEFPKDAKKDKKTGKDNISVIRLLTRLIFCWFMKEKEELIPSKLFNKSEIEKLLRDLSDTESTYYKAILQNLFFATLNTDLDKREFRTEERHKKGHNDDFGNQYVYRFAKLFNKQEEFESLFKNIPYLNGGIFECLDIRGEEIPKEKWKYIDGFSDTKKNQPIVPNKLFFADEITNAMPYGCDLNHIYDTNNRKYTLAGIINILKSFNFTIDEHSETDQEIALSPELLGNVFESLLAYYNPETSQNARKQQGSYYTPTQIVNYMVDESLKQYFKNCIENRPKSFVEIGAKQTNMFANEGVKGQTSIHLQTDNCFLNSNIIVNEIENLVSFQNKNVNFNKEEKLFLINSILKIKILDPACGSGAFPMGVLNKLVHVLGKLDNEGEYLKDVLIQFKNSEKENLTHNKEKLNDLIKDKEQAEKISLEKARQVAIAEIEKEIDRIKHEFKINQPNFTRKLYLIKNCIYGVDIQNIAVTISKLRFFLSLLVDTTIYPDEINKGIKPLPNLDYKLIQGNSLLESFEDIDLDFSKFKESDLFGNSANTLKKSDIKKIHELINNYFYEPDHKKKKKINDEIDTIITKYIHYVIDLNIDNLKKNLKKTEEQLKINEKNQKTANTKALENKYLKEITKIQKEIEKLKTDIEHKKEQKKIIDKILFEKDNDQWFLWHLFFKDVFEAGGFDIVIGNPPYVSANNMSLKDREMINTSGYYQTLKGKWDIYIPFVERSLNVLNDFGSLTFIIPYGLLNQPFAEDLRKLILDKNKISSIADLHEEKIFAATVPTCIPFISKKIEKKYSVKINEYIENSIQLKYLLDIENYRNATQYMFRTENYDEISPIISKIKNTGIKLSKYFYVSTGAEIHGKEKRNGNELISGHSKFDVLHKEYQAGFKPYIEGSAIPKSKDGRYCFPKIDYYIDYNNNVENMRSPKFPELFDSNKLIVRRASGIYGILATYDDRKLINCENSLNIICRNDLNVRHKDYLEYNLLSIKYLLSIINSSLIRFYYNSVYAGFIAIFPNNLKEIPIPEIPEPEQQPFIKLVDEIIEKKKHKKDTQDLENRIDIMVYKLYQLVYAEVKIIDPEIEKLISEKEYNSKTIEELANLTT